MVGLRKACSFVLLAWVVFSPLVLSWHHALAHGCSQHSIQSDAAVECCVSAAAEMSTPSCPFGNDIESASSIQPNFSGERCCPESNGNQPCKQDGSCRICELLLLDDVVTVQWFSIPKAIESTNAEPVVAPTLVCSEVLFSWTVRGPPSLA